MIFLEKAKSNLRLCVVNKGNEQSAERGLFCCFVVGIFFLRLKTRWDSRIEPVFSQVPGELQGMGLLEVGGAWVQQRPLRQKGRGGHGCFTEPLLCARNFTYITSTA